MRDVGIARVLQRYRSDVSFALRFGYLSRWSLQEVRVLIKTFDVNEPNPYRASASPGATPTEPRGLWRKRIFATFGLLLAVSLLLLFAGSRWGKWPWYFSPREAFWDRFELVAFFLIPMAFTALISLFAGRACRWIIGILALTFLLSLV